MDAAFFVASPRSEAVARLLTAPGVSLVSFRRAGADLQPEAKARLRDATNAAIAEGVFGVPTVLADGELFWGHDSFDHLDRFLGGEDPVDAELLERWAHIRPSATRG